MRGGVLRKDRPMPIISIDFQIMILARQSEEGV